MRKRVINHVADTIFWYILYFLPVLAYLFFVISAPVRNNVENNEVAPVTVEYEERTICTIPADVPFEVISTDLAEFSFVFFLEGDLSDDSSFSALYMGVVYAFPVAPDVLAPFIYPDLCYFDNSSFSLFVPYSFEIPLGTFFENDLLFFSSLEATSYETPFVSFDSSLLQYSTEYVYQEIPTDSISTGMTYDFKDFVNEMGFEFATDNIIVNTLGDIFGTGGVMPLFDNDTPFIIFAWFIGVYLLHLLVDFILFIPRIAHKWMKDCTGGD